jgi:hypothetical protein
VSFVSFVVNPFFHLVAALPRWDLGGLRGELFRSETLRPLRLCGRLFPGAHFYLSTVAIGLTFQMSRQYSRIERSDEKRPTRALLRIDMRVQFF